MILKPSGKCYLCQNTFSKGGMSRHLKTCLEKHAPQVGKGKEGKRGARKGTLHVQVEDRYNPEYWMHLELPANTTLFDLDGFLRSIWLECCGHLSAFYIHGECYSVESGLFDDHDMNVRLARAVRVGETFLYEYDFGSTTYLKLRLVGTTRRPSSGEDISVLARNDQPQYQCDHCDNIARYICPECIYDDEGSLCAECAKEHKCGEEMLLPIVNSPRTGVCAYMGDSCMED